jgi:hypothetical protein
VFVPKSKFIDIDLNQEMVDFFISIPENKYRLFTLILVFMTIVKSESSKEISFENLCITHHFLFYLISVLNIQTR